MNDVTGMQDYTKPDGSVVRLPPQLASMFSETLKPVKPSEPVLPAPDPSWTLPQTMTESGMLGGGGLDTLPETDAGLMTPAVAPPPRPSPAAATSPVEAGPAIAPPVAPTAPQAPQPRPRTDADLVRGGVSAPLAQQEAALTQQAAGVEAAARAEADALTKQGEETAARNAKVDEILAERQKAAQERMQRIEAATLDADRATKAYADHKVSREIAHPVLAFAAVMLSAVGDSLNGKHGGENAAFNALMNQLDKNVQLQMDERAKLKDVAGAKRQAIDAARVAGDDKIAMYNLAMAGEIERAARQFERIGMETKSDQVRANAVTAIGVLREKQAGYVGQAVDRAVTLDEQRKQREEQIRQAKAGEAQGWARIRQADRHHKDLLVEKAKDREADIAKAITAASGTKAKTLSEAAEKARALGLINPVTGEPLLRADGDKAMKEAATLEKQAEQLRANGSDAARQQADVLSKKATELRAEAQTIGAATGRRPEHAEAVQKMLSDTQTALGMIDEIKKDARLAGKKVLNANEIQSRLGANLEILSLTLKERYRLGALDDGTTAKLNAITGGDPSKLTTAGVMGAMGIGSASAEQTAVRLEAVAKSLEAASYNDLRGVGVQGFRFKRDNETDRPEFKAASALLDEKTPQELAAGEGRGAAGKVLLDAPADAGRAAYSAIVGGVGGTFESSEGERRRMAEEGAASKKYPGLASSQDKAMDTLLAQARGRGVAADRAKAKLVQIATENATSRPSLSNAVLGALESSAPEVYRQAVAALPEEQRQDREALAKVGREGAPLDQIESRALGGDTAAAQELMRRAQATPGGPEAKAFVRLLKAMDDKRKADATTWKGAR